MADAIAASLSPGLIEPSNSAGKLTGQLKLEFTKPTQPAKIEILFFESDSWTSDGRTIKESDTAQRLIGTIEGVLSNGQFKETAQVIPFSKEPFTVLLTVSIGAEKITMPIPNVGRDKELDFFEITFRARGTINGKFEVYDSPSPVFVRNTPTPRAEVAFIAGTARDFPDDPVTFNYFPIAERYWRRLQDNKKTGILTLASILKFIGSTDDKVVKARNGLPWGRINIVSHGAAANGSAAFAGTWFIRRVDDGDDPSDGLDASNLPGLNLGPSPSRKEVDEHTEIIIRGCEIGEDKALLNAIRDKFGGLAKVFAPKLENNYHEDGRVARDQLFEHWSFSLPGGNRAFPPPNELATLLQRLYGQHSVYRRFTPDQWHAVAAISGGPAQNPNAFRTARQDSTNGPVSADCDEDEVKEDEINPKTNKPTGRKVLKSQAKLTAMMRAKDIIPKSEFDQLGFNWTVTRKKTPPKADPLFLVSSIGRSTFLQIYRRLTTVEAGRTVPVIPDPKNPDQFGQV
jgi:hypothetical protein